MLAEFRKIRDKRAVHMGGRHILDYSHVVRRYITIQITASHGLDDEVETEVTVSREAKPPRGWPADGWIVLEE